MPDLGPFRTVIDLTHVLDSRSPNWEGTVESPFQATELGNLQRDGYYSRVFTTQEHYGTHLDAPAHFAAGGWTVDQIPAERLVRPLAVIDVREQAKDDADYEVSVQDVEHWETTHSAVPSGAVVCACVGWERFWGSPREYRNEQPDGLTHYSRVLARSRDVSGRRTSARLGWASTP